MEEGRARKNDSSSLHLCGDTHIAGFMYRCRDTDFAGAQGLMLVTNSLPVDQLRGAKQQDQQTAQVFSNSIPRIFIPPLSLCTHKI